MNSTNKKSAFLKKTDFRLAGAGGLEPATHGFGENLFEFEVAI